MRNNPTARRRRRQQLRVLGILLVVLGLCMHTQSSPWTPFPVIIGCFIIAYALRRTRYDSQP